MLLAAAVPRPATAQLGFLEGIFQTVEDIELGLVAARLGQESPLAPRALRGFMVEVSFGAPHTRGDSAGSPPVEIEFALGYGLLTGFGAGAPGYTLTGTVEELPSIMVYASVQPHPRVSPYLGVRTGIARLQGFRAYVGEDQQLHTAVGVTYLAGGVAGIAIGGDALMFFIEGSLVYRRFASVEWAPVGDLVPAILPRTLPFSTAGLSVGLQMAVRE